MYMRLCRRSSQEAGQKKSDHQCSGSTILVNIPQTQAAAVHLANSLAVE
jgi:hypothetical protein